MACSILRPMRGSPLRMRGKEVHTVLVVPLVGITPACAGKRCHDEKFSCIIQDHPRVCGEKQVTGFASDNAEGSPPRVRGKERDDEEQPGLCGITPAYAGKSP